MEVPRAEDEKLRFGRVGIIAVVGFVIGMLWPRLAGVKLVPDAPVGDEQAGVAEQPAASAAAPAGTPLAAKSELEQRTAALPQAGERLRVSEGQVTSCRDESNKRQAECDKVDFDRVARARLQALASCPAALESQGTLSLGFELDFDRKKLTEIVKGKSTSLQSETADAVLQCARKQFESASIDGLEHRARGYTIFYKVDFLPPNAGASAGPDMSRLDAGSEPALAAGRATVTWEVAILRSAPKDGDIVARVLRGTRVVVTGRQDDWYKVRYDAKGNEGWVFRTAIGL